MFHTLIKIAEIILNPFVVPFTIIAVWISICYAVGKNSDWKTLREHFSYQIGRKSNGRKNIKLHPVTGEIGKIGYGGMLKVGTIAEGMVLKIYMPRYLPWLIGYPMLLIPWSSIAAIQISKPQPSPDNFLVLKIRSKIQKGAFFAQSAEITLKDSQTYI
jgi:hypothetical protein